MFLARKPTEPVTAASALPGRGTPIPTSSIHLVLGTPIQPPFPEGLARLVDTTVVTIAPASGHLVDVTIRRETSEFHSFATSPEAQELLHRLHAELDPATVYVGGGTHASALERGLTGRDVNLTTKWRPCGHGQALAAAELDKAKPLLEMLYLLRRDGDSCQAPDPVAGRRFRA